MWRRTRETDARNEPANRKSSTHMDCATGCLVRCSREPALDFWAIVSGVGNLRHREGREFIRTNRYAQSASRCVLARCLDMARIRLLVHCLRSVANRKLIRNPSVRSNVIWAC